MSSQLVLTFLHVVLLFLQLVLTSLQPVLAFLHVVLEFPQPVLASLHVVLVSLQFVLEFLQLVLPSLHVVLASLRVVLVTESSKFALLLSLDVPMEKAEQERSCSALFLMDVRRPYSSLKLFDGRRLSSRRSSYCRPNASGGAELVTSRPWLSSPLITPVLSIKKER